MMKRGRTKQFLRLLALGKWNKRHATPASHIGMVIPQGVRGLFRKRIRSLLTLRNSLVQALIFNNWKKKRYLEVQWPGHAGCESNICHHIRLFDQSYLEFTGKPATSDFWGVRIWEDGPILHSKEAAVPSPMKKIQITPRFSNRSPIWEPWKLKVWERQKEKSKSRRWMEHYLRLLHWGWLGF